MLIVRVELHFLKIDLIQAFSYAAGMVDKDYQEQHKCRLTIGNINYGWQYSFMGIARHSPYIEEFHRE
jgi:hypothetical protein